jgi:hypothetical protein
MTITEFLLARIAEDEDDARHADRGFRVVGFPAGTPAHVLAECEAKRRIVEFAAGASNDRASVISEFAVGRQQEAAMWADDPGEKILRALAAVYSDHPDYDESWRP